MRTRVFGWMILGLAVCAPPWDSARQPGHAGGKPGAAASTGGTHGMRPSTPAPIASATAMPAAEIVAGATARAATREPLAVPAQRERGSGTQGPPAPPATTSPAVAVREFAPGSRAHSQAIASHIDSDEIREVVSPLARLYLGYFGRVPDYEGLDYYAGERGRGEPLDAVADEFAGSAEFAARYGALDNAAFVARVLENILGFPGDAQQRAYWIDQIESGSMTRGQVMLAFSESPGYRAHTAHEVFVAIAYAQTLGRAPDASDLARWVSFLDGGNPRSAVIESLLALRTRPPARPTPRRD